MVKIDGHEVEKTFATSRRHGVAGVINIRPSISALRETAISQQVQDALWVRERERQVERVRKERE